MSIDELEGLFARVIQKLKAANYSPEMLSEYDEYWHVNSPECFDLTIEPRLCVGSLQHDCQELNEVALDPEILLPYVAFDRLASVLKALSNQLNS